MRKRLFAAILALGILSGGAAAIVPAAASVSLATASHVTPKMHYYE